MTNPKELGGIGFPSFKNYYHASHLARIIDWHCHERGKDWVTLEAKLCSIPLMYTPWRSLSATIRRHPIRGTTLEILSNITKRTDVTTVPSPLTPLGDSPDFVPGIQNATLHSRSRNAPLLAGDCFLGGKLRDWTSLKTESDLPHLKLWTYFQLRSYLGKFRQSQNL